MGRLTGYDEWADENGDQGQDAYLDDFFDRADADQD
jgi:hypothetical protein